MSVYAWRCHWDWNVTGLNSNDITIDHENRIKEPKLRLKAKIPKQKSFWLVVSSPLKNISQIGNHPQVGVKVKNI